jgi:hypothetical protein
MLDATAHARIELTFRQRIQQAVVVVDQQQVFHGVLDGNECNLVTVLGVGTIGTAAAATTGRLE